MHARAFPSKAASEARGEESRTHRPRLHMHYGFAAPPQSLRDAQGTEWHWSVFGTSASCTGHARARPRKCTIESVRKQPSRIHFHAIEAVGSVSCKGRDARICEALCEYRVVRFRHEAERNQHPVLSPMGYNYVCRFKR